MLARRVAMVVTAVALAVLVGSPPRAARASSFSDPLIISGAIAGGVAAVLLLSIALADRNPPEDFEEFAPPAAAHPPRAVLPWGARTCPPRGDGTLPLVCW
jgi:hypothetical protein